MNDIEKAIASYLCGDISRGKHCPHHEEQAEEIHQVVVRAQAREREKIAKEALDRLAASGNLP